MIASPSNLEMRGHRNSDNGFKIYTIAFFYPCESQKTLNIWIWFQKVNLVLYYMTVSDKDWELPNSRIWLAEIDIKSGLDFPI